MDKTTFNSLLKYYLSCMDAEDAANLKLRKNQEYKSYIFLEEEKETLFSENLPKLELHLTENREISFIKQKVLNTESITDLRYGFPVFVDEKDMLSPLFFVEVETTFLSDKKTLRILPNIKKLFCQSYAFFAYY